MFWGGNAAHWRRATAAVLAGAVVGLAGAAPAFADDPAVATPRGAGKDYGHVQLENVSRQTDIGPMWLRFDDGEALAYCIDLHHPVALGKKYEEGSWQESKVPNLAKVQWVLLHGYPEAKTSALLGAAGATQGELTAERVTELLYVATQVSVWHFSDKAVLSAAGKGLNPVEFDLVKKVYTYLTTNAGSDAVEPKAQLTIGPATATATVGKQAGPFTVTGPSGDIALSVEGGTAVDEAGKPVTTAANGGKFWLTRDGAGDVSVTAKAETTHSTGRVFLFKGTEKRQKLILAGTVGDELTAGVKAAFVPGSTPSASPSVSVSPSSVPSASPSSPAPSATTPAAPAPGTGGGDELPLTGASTYAVLGVGLLLLAGGAVAVLVVRRRRVSFTA